MTAALMFFPASSIARAARVLARLVTLLTALATSHAAMTRGEDRPKLPEPIRTTQTTFSIPFRLPETRSAEEAPVRVVLSASQDLGATWQEVDEAVPQAGQFVYHAASDGEYWFRLRSVDAKGRRRGGQGPDVRVLVDAGGPRVAGHVWLGPDGEVVCRFAAFDDSLRLETLRLEYRTTAAPTWQSVAVVGLLSRESPAHMVGEEIWWAGDDPTGLTVRLAVSDNAGNETVRQFTLAPRDPGIDQNALAREIGAPPLPGPEAGGDASTMASNPAAHAVPDAMASRGPAWLRRGEAVEANWSAGPPASADRSPLSSVLAPASLGGSKGLPPGAQPSGETRPTSTATADPGSTRFHEDATASLTNPPMLSSGKGDGAAPVSYRGKPLHLTKTRRFMWDYDIEHPPPASQKYRVELWGSRDGGVTWQRVAVDGDTISPIEVSLEHAGLHGFRLEAVPDRDDLESGPRSGDEPECWVGIDDSPPQVEILSVSIAEERSESGEETVLIRYSATDPLIVSGSARIVFSPSAEGPWATIAERLDVAGQHRWTPGRHVPSRVYVRVEASDAAGNLGHATTPDAVLVSPRRQVGRLGGLRPLPASEVSVP